MGEKPACARLSSGKHAHRPTFARPLAIPFLYRHSNTFGFSWPPAENEMLIFRHPFACVLVTDELMHFSATFSVSARPRAPAVWGAFFFRCRRCASFDCA